jgi:hypothetical protein
MIIDFYQNKIAVVGSRDFPNLGIVRRFVHSYLRDAALIVSGGADGVDRTAISTAKLIGVNTREFLIKDVPDGANNPEKWRNSQIVDEADIVIAFWHNRSGGTKDTMDKTRLAGKMLITIEV